MTEPLHYVRDSGQPYGSMSRCCSICGRMCWPGREGSAERWTNDYRVWLAATDNCYQTGKKDDDLSS